MPRPLDHRQRVRLTAMRSITGEHCRKLRDPALALVGFKREDPWPDPIPSHVCGVPSSRLPGLVACELLLSHVEVDADDSSGMDGIRSYRFGVDGISRRLLRSHANALRGPPEWSVGG